MKSGKTVKGSGKKTTHDEIKEEKMNLVEKIEKSQLRNDLPFFKAGDKVRVHAKIKEGDKERIQVFEGTVIKKNNASCRSRFTVRKIASGVGVERTFPGHSPLIDKIDVVTVGHVRQARLYYLRDRKGKAARIKEKRMKK